MQGDKEERILEKEELLREKVDERGERWRKVYFGSGAHFRNWLEQCIEICGRQNVEVEEVDIKGLRCFEKGEGKAYRIWVREGIEAALRREH